MKTPNIFDYATSELSQDAFLCWLIACSGCDDVSLANLGRGFIGFLYNSASKDTEEIQPDQVKGLVETPNKARGAYPWTQYENIDVYFQAEINGKKVSFIIEDKISTQMHGNQLERYGNKIEDDEILEDEIRKIYLKTGYVYEKERQQVEESGYSVIDIGAFTQFLSEHAPSIHNDIFRCYLVYIGTKKAQMDRVLEGILNFYEGTESHHDIFQHPYAQWKCMLSMAEVIKGALSEGDIKNKFGAYAVGEDCWEHGTNRGGDPWTQFYWYSATGKYQKKDIVEYLFWRLDGWYPLRLRHGVWPEEDEMYDDFDKDRRERLSSFRQIFEEEAREIFKDALKYPSGKTGNESSVGQICFNAPENSVRHIIEKLPEFHRRFIPRILSEC